MSRFDAIRTERVKPEVASNPPGVAAVPGRTPARIGKKAVGGYYSPQLSQALNMLALEQNTSLQALLGEAIDDLMRKYGKHPFGER
ncbi:ribbon-helix-helix domain-containing protein [uncultured Phenylobacterium sp.]|uniref:ribbon-helix-helix domain-containing protein n=1 Tax=uncultured Phenylobacterium sp. TaxID=349273 RepID=UPI0025FC31F0|nr:ribbon-helix-helix domain-containing protein [uncultured Phenylobacterium sp.]